jgi:hypothetical protein
MHSDSFPRLLERIVESDYDVFARRVRLPLWEKSWIVVRALVGPRTSLSERE